MQRSMHVLQKLAVFGVCAASLAGCSTDTEDNPGPVALEDSTTSDTATAETAADVSVDSGTDGGTDATVTESGTDATSADTRDSATAADTADSATAADTTVTDGAAADIADIADTADTADTADAYDATDTNDTAPYCAIMGDPGDAAAVCPGGQWRNTATNACVACPAASLTCGSGGITGATVNMTNKTMTLTIANGALQPVSGTMRVGYRSFCNGPWGQGGSGESGVASAPVTVVGNTLVADLSGLTFDAGMGVPCGTHLLSVKDACCNDHTVQVYVNYDSESGGNTAPGFACPGASDAGTDAADGG